jgi:hypothetical protein
MKMLISLVAEGFRIQDPTDRYDIRVPISIDGLRILQSILRARDEGVSTKLGTRASPTQWEIDRMKKEYIEKKFGKLMDVEVDL